jgi:Polysaccharide biosynthesis enzyme WcbI
MARFFLIGICQIEGITKCLRGLHPEGEVEGHTLWTLEETFENEDRLFAYMRTFDFIIVQDFGEDTFGVLSADLIREIFPRTYTLPGFLFSAFHPDIVYVPNAAPKPDEHRTVQSAIGDYHSALAVFGFLQNLSVEKTHSLYRGEVYESLGYMNMWAESEAFLLAPFRGYGWPVDRFYIQWVRRGVFMYTINHPKLFVLADIARMILARCNVAFVDDAVEERLIDPLMSGPIWPVYPAIAEQFGLTGSMSFKKIELDSYASLMLDLPRFIAGSFAELQKVPRENILCPRVQEWIANGALNRFL